MKLCRIKCWSDIVSRYFLSELSYYFTVHCILPRTETVNDFVKLSYICRLYSAKVKSQKS